MAEIDHMGDADLVKLTCQGKPDAYRPLVARYQGHVYGLAYSIVGDWAEAQDIAQETFIRAYSNLDQLHDPAKFAAWLRRVAFGVAMDWIRTFRPKLFAQVDGKVNLDELEIPDFAPGPAEVAERRELADAVLRAVASLPPKYRVPLTMFHLDGLSYQKVADFLDIPLGTAKSLVSRAEAKLKAILTATAKEMIPMVQEVFDEHKLPQEFTAKVIANVPTLAWGHGKDCTFAGALEAAMAVTPHPFTYSQIMGFTGLAFRVRWYKGPKDVICPSCAVGEMEEEIEAAAKATGWPLKIEVHFDPKERLEALGPIILAINAGKPVPAYTEQLDMGLVYGYAEGGKKLLFRDYNNQNESSELPAHDLGWLWLILGDYKPIMSQREAVIEGLKIAVRNWRREVGKEGPGEYWYGPAAYRAWRSHLENYASLPEDKRKVFFHTNWWNMLALCDARRSAAAFLEENASLLGSSVRENVLRAAAGYRQLASFVDANRFPKAKAFLVHSQPIQDWTPEVRQREIAVLNGIERLDGAAIAELDRALRA